MEVASGDILDISNGDIMFRTYPLGIKTEAYSIVQVCREEGKCLLFAVRSNNDLISIYVAAVEFANNRIKENMNSFTNELKEHGSVPLFVDGDVLQMLRVADSHFHFGLPQTNGVLMLVERFIACTFSKLVSSAPPYVTETADGYFDQFLARKAEKERMESHERDEFVTSAEPPVPPKRRRDNTPAMLKHTSPGLLQINPRVETPVPPNADIHTNAVTNGGTSLVQRSVLLTLVTLDRSIRDAMPNFTEKQRDRAEALLKQANILMTELLL